MRLVSFELLNELLLLFNLGFEHLLIVLLSLSASDGRFSILQSLPCFLVLERVIKVRVGTIFVDDGVIEVLLLLVCKLVKVDHGGDLVLVARRLLIGSIVLSGVLIWAATSDRVDLISSS